ncbi:MAG: hypothetical protein WC294_09720 [Methanoregula sp.]|jgi:uncharacterized DUF497 family protein
MPDKTGIPSWRKTGILLCLWILVVALLSAGCTALFPAMQNTGPGTAVLPAHATRPVPDNCTFDREMEGPDVRQPGLDSCYFGTHSPMEYLNDLRMHPDRAVLVPGVPYGWITLHDAELLMQVIDSAEPAAPVISPLSSYWPANQTSTVGNEALFLLEGYRAGRYPPGLCSLNYFRPERAEVRTWWDTYGKRGLPDERDAVRIVQETWPDLRDYPSETRLKTLGTQKAPDGWYVAFIQEGSGLPIVSARCYHVGNDRAVRQSGLLNHSIMVQLGDFSPKACG